MKTQQVRCLVFDWDGTLIDSIDRIVTSLQVAARITCHRELPEQACRNVIGMGLMDAIAALLPDHDRATQELAAAAYKQDFLHDSQVPSPLFDGVTDCLNELHQRGYLLAIATGKSRPGLDRALEEHDVGHLFATTRCAGEYPSKPEPEMLLSILRDFAIHPAEALMIGDSEHDMRMANNAGVAAVAVTHGAHGADTLLRHRPLVCLDHITDISGVLSHNRPHNEPS